MSKFASSAAAAALLVILTAGIFAQGVPAPYTPRLQTFVTGLSRPIFLRGANDGSRRIFVVQQAGIIKVFQPGSNVATDFINLSSKCTQPTSTGDERGLLGLTFHPNFASNGKFYVNYTQVSTGTTIIAEYTTTTGNGNSNTGNINSERVLLTIPQPFTNHNGGMIDFGPDGYLYIGTGDGGSANDPGARAQNRSVLLGKFLRIDPNSTTPAYLIPFDNPYTGAGSARCDNGSTTAGTNCQEIWAYGIRNPWRWSFDRGGTNQLYAGDVGQGSIEELDIINGGNNYGWRVYEGTTCTGLDPTLCIPGNFTMPFFTYTHSAGRCSVTGGFVYRGAKGSLPNGAYTYADYCSGEVWMWNNNAQTLLFSTGRSVVSFGQDEYGEIYVLTNNGQIDKIVRGRAPGDFDGDLKTDAAVFRPSETYWYIQNSSNSTVRAAQFGVADDVLTPGDYDGDNITDIGVFRPSSGTWFFLRSSDNTFGAYQFGASSDTPQPGDFDGDRKTDFAVYRRPTGVWYVIKSSNGSFSAVQFGTSTDLPVAGDYDGDGLADFTVFRPSNGVWYRLASGDLSFSATQFGTVDDVPVPGDIDGDGRLDLTVFRPSNGVWYSLTSNNNSFSARQWGLSTDIPVPGDYDGDGKADQAVFRPTNGVWYVLRSSNSALQATQFGANLDVPAARWAAP